ncbi:hypothetical protein [Enterococcus sp. AZ177]|uniref:hypothetical protein n=1 Tax=unclassified Enterococcus TaxID=2608891 RepID=UPI003D2FE61C
MTEHDFKNATKIDTTDLVRNTMKPDPSQNGSPIPFQSGYSEYEARKGTQSSCEIMAFYFLGIFFSIIAYYSLINLSILNGEWQNDGIKVAIVIFSTIAVSFIVSKILIIFVKKLKKKFLP